MASYTYEFIELGDEVVLGCKCCRFGDGYDLPVPKKLSNDETAKHARDFSHSIFANWTKLNAILKRFEETIQKRWLKKTLKQKRDVLLKAWPDMAPTHRPDFAAFRHAHKKPPRSRTLRSAAYLWPYINLEDLQHRDNLLHFLGSRGRNLPEVFLHADLEAAHLGNGWHVEMTPEDMHISFKSNRSPLTYGKLMPPDAPAPKSHRQAKSTKISKSKVELARHPYTGLLILEIQQGIYSFLLACAKAVLHDIEPRQFFLAPIRPIPTIPECHMNQWSSISALMQQIPYRTPQKMDIAQLKLLVGSRKSSAEDHLWMLREDPGYFIETLKDEKEHDRMTLKHTCSTCWANVAGRTMTDALTYYLQWDQVYKLLDLLPSMDSQLQKADYETMRLPRKYERIWATLHACVTDMIEVPIGRLYYGVPPSPRMRHCFKWIDSPKEDKDVWESHIGTMSDAEYRVFVLFHAICKKNRRELHSLNHLVQEIQYMFDTDSEASQLVDPWIVSHFSDLALLSELKLRIEGLHPWFVGLTAAGVSDSRVVLDSVGEFFHFDEQIRNIFTDAKRGVVFEWLRDPLHSSWDYPASRARTETNVKQMQVAEDRLDCIWDEMEDAGHYCSDICLTKTILRRLWEPRKLHRTPDWTPPPQEDKKKKAALTEVSPNLPHISHAGAIARRAESFKSTPEPKRKVKTHGLPTPQSRNDENHTSSFDTTPTSPISPIPHEQQIKLPKRAYKVFAALLPLPSAEHHQRTELSWDEMIQALNTVGLRPQKLYGSVWVFSPKARELCLVAMERSIQFHEPKEVRKGSKISGSMVRVFGRRLKHAYGWEGGMFCCE